jgi:hypothetical protein
MLETARRCVLDRDVFASECYQVAKDVQLGVPAVTWMQ